MIGAKKYQLSTGQIVEDYPYPFRERDEWVERAKALEEKFPTEHLPKKKKLPKLSKEKKEEIEKEFLENPDLKEYRELMVKIWRFSAPVYIVKEIPCCERCKDHTVKLYDLAYHTEFPNVVDGKLSHFGYDYVEVVCRKCAMNRRELYGRYFRFDSLKINTDH